MARSYKKTPITGNAGGSDKYDKRMANRRLRMRVKTALKKGHDLLPELREVSCVCAFSKDGKQWLSPANREKWMRK
jgi:hypothetical protein